MKKFIYNNGLSLVFLLLFVVSLIGQWLTGFAEYNKKRNEDGQHKVSLSAYSHSGHFIQATFENWESEFLQMALFVLLTIALKQKGSSESKKFDGSDEVDREPSSSSPDAPWPVRKGGWMLQLYKNSLSIALLALFLFSFALHFYGSYKDENDELAGKHKPAVALVDYMADTRFWFESLQNWQSEFLSFFGIVGLSVYLRQQGSPQSKPVDAPHHETGE